MTPENPFIPPLNLPGPGARLRYAGQSAGSPMVESGPVITRPPHVVAEQNRAVKRAAEYSHPWKITVDEDLALSVGVGSVTAMTLLEDQPQPIFEAVPVDVDNIYTGDPEDPEGLDINASPLTIVASQSYGVWVRLERSPLQGNTTVGDDADFAGVSYMDFTPGATIFVSEDYLGPGFSGVTGTAIQPPFNDDFAYYHIGTVVVSSEEVVTIDQRKRSDIDAGFFSYPQGINFPEEEPPP